MKKEILIGLSFIILFSFHALAGFQPDETLLKLAHSEWNDVQLQSYDLHNSNFTNEQMEYKVRQAVIWLETAQRLVGSNAEVFENLEYLYRSEMVNDPGRAMDALSKYSDLKPKDNLCVDGWMKYRLGQLNQRSRRDYFIESMQPNLTEYPMVLSDMLTLRGIFAAEQGNIDSAAIMFENAWNLWPYNVDAGARLLSLPLLQVDTENPSISAEEQESIKLQIEQNHLLRSIYYRVMCLTNNPNNIDMAIELADLLYSLNKFDKAAQFYSHGIKLLELSDNENSSAVLNGLIFKHAICMYNIGRYQECINILSKIQVTDLDLPTTALQILALKKLENNVDANELIKLVNSYVDSLNIENIDKEQSNRIYIDLAWLYCFAADDIEKAKSYAAKVVYENDNPPSLIVYINYISGVLQDNQSIVDNYVGEDPLSIFTAALLDLNNSKSAEALDKLEHAINSSPGVLYCFIKDKISQINNQNVPDVAQQDVIDSIFKLFSNEILDIAFNPEKYIQYSINSGQKVYKYNDVIVADISITNISQVDRIIGSSALIDPYVYIYAEIAPVLSGDIKPKIYPITLRYLAQEPVLRPGFSNTVKDVFSIGKVDDILSIYPQMAYEIKYYCIPSPYIENGKVFSNTPKLIPEPVAVERRAFNPSPQRVSSYFNMLRSGQPDERIEAANLFASILGENKLASKNKLFYQSAKLDYKKTISSIVANLSHENPSIRAWTIYSLRRLLKDDKYILNAVTAKLDDPDWLVRLMALNVLHDAVNIDSVIKWFAENEKDETILRQIHLWQGKEWEIIDLPFDIPE